MIVYFLDFVHFFAGPLLKPAAYLDPGSGSFILQILLASLLAFMLFFKSWWGKLLGMFRKSQPAEDDDTFEDEDPQAKS